MQLHAKKRGNNKRIVSIQKADQAQLRLCVVEHALFFFPVSVPELIFHTTERQFVFILFNQSATSA